MKKIVVIVDMQNDFVNTEGALYVKEADSLINPTNDFVSKIHNVDAILITKDTHDEKEYPASEEGAMFAPHCLKGTWGHELAFDIDKIPANTPVFFVEKDVFNMWQKENPIFSQNGEKIEGDFFKGVQDAIVFGVASDFCVKDAITGLLDKGIEVKWVDDLSKGIITQAKDVVKNINHANLKLIKTAQAFEMVRS